MRKEAQNGKPRIKWTLYGGSRGGVWGAILAADARLKWSRVLLVAPYVFKGPAAGGRAATIRKKIARGFRDG